MPRIDQSTQNERSLITMLSTQITSIHDRQRLMQAVDRALGSWVTYAPYLDFFRRQLRRSRTVPIHEVPEDMITMNSRFALRDESTGEIVRYTLVYPEDESTHDGKLSVLSPMGMVLYGAKAGQEVCWTSAAGPEVATVMELLYQPESAERGSPALAGLPA
jgi:regulator of nucleoside diphosphate kinase